MVNKRFWLGILVMALIFGMAVVGCDNGTTDPVVYPDPLNGTWVSSSGGVEQEMKLANGSMEISMDGTVAMQGTYTASAGKITTSITAVHGDFLTEMSGGYFELDSKWYSEDNLKTAIKDLNLGMSDEQIEQSFGSMFAENTADYSISGSTLTMTDENGLVSTATRK